MLLIKLILGSENNFRSFKGIKSKLENAKSENWLTRTQNQQRDVRILLIIFRFKSTNSLETTEKATKSSKNKHM